MGGEQKRSDDSKGWQGRTSGLGWFFRRANKQVRRTRQTEAPEIGCAGILRLLVRVAWPGLFSRLTLCPRIFLLQWVHVCACACMPACHGFKPRNDVHWWACLFVRARSLSSLNIPSSPCQNPCRQRRRRRRARRRSGIVFCQLSTFLLPGLRDPLTSLLAPSSFAPPSFLLASLLPCLPFPFRCYLLPCLRCSLLAAFFHSILWFLHSYLPFVFPYILRPTFSFSCSSCLSTRVCSLARPMIWLSFAFTTPESSIGL